jgi:tetratricopeptide (TPR) repeat protein
MSVPPPAVPLARLAQRLRAGAAGDDGEVRQVLGLTPDVADRDLARTLVRTLATAQLANVRVGPDRDRDLRQPIAPALITAPDASFLGQLAAKSDAGVEQLDDVQTLLAVLRAGTLQQRRAAAVRLRARLAESRDLSSELMRSVTTTLVNLRDVEIAFEVAHAREALPGAPGRAARQATEEFERAIETLLPAIDDFWAGISSAEPISAMPPDHRAQLMVRLRDAPDVVLRHIASLLDGSDGVATRQARAALLSSLRCAGDARLVPCLVGLLATRNADFVAEAARALARIDDPRAHPALAAAYERSVVDVERAVLAGALGLQRDTRGRDYVGQLLASDDERVLLAAARAMDALATREDCPRLVPLLMRTDPILLAAVVRAIGRAGDPRGLGALAELRTHAAMSALWGDVEEAEATIRATMELRGEEPPEASETLSLASAPKSAPEDGKREPTLVRVRGWIDYVLGTTWLALGGAARAIARFERAHGRRPRWAAPLASIAIHHAKKKRIPQALAAFRRALEADRRWVERQEDVVGALARVFLRRAEEVEQSGRVDIARGLIEEVRALDLRRVPSELRFELQRRQEHLRRGAG